MCNWISEFESKFKLKFFKNPYPKSEEEQEVVYFENMKQTEWYVKIDNNIKVITVKKLIHDNIFDRNEKEKEIVEFLILNSEKWSELGFKEIKYSLFEIKSVKNKNYSLEFTYWYKETLNAFGGYDWFEF